MLQSLMYVFLLFLIYSFFGWLIDIIGYYIASKKIVNRGFLNGPYCPIYGFGALIILFSLAKYKEDPITLFIIAVLYISILEYFTSFLLEKIFNARWWDYSNNILNLNGRISLFTSISFGIFGLFLIYIVDPFFLKLLYLIPKNILFIISISLFTIIIMDFIFTIVTVSKLKKNIHLFKIDVTEEVREHIAKKINKNRILKAFPNLNNHLNK